MNFNNKLVYNIVTYNFCMIPHSLTFLFIFGHFGLKQNPTGLQEVIQRLDKNSKTILIIKSNLERSFLMKKYQKNSFLKTSVFPEYNLQIELVSQSQLVRVSQLELVSQSYSQLELQLVRVSQLELVTQSQLVRVGQLELVSFQQAVRLGVTN